MLAQAVMLVVIVLNEIISSGTPKKGDGGEMEFKGQSIHNVPQRRVGENISG